MLNRLMTQREQFLLLFVALALVVGAASVYFFREEAPAVPEVAPVGAAMPRNEAREADAVLTPPAQETPPPALPAPPPPREAASSSEPAAPKPPEEIAVAAMGAVANEGLYRLPTDARVGDLLKKAGGASEEADLSDINLGARLIDGTTLTVPAKATAQLADGKITLRGAQVMQAPNPPQYSRAYAAAHAGEAVAADAPAEAVSADAPAASGARATGGRINLNTASQAELETLPGIGPALAQRIVEYRTQTPFTTVEQLDEVSGFGEKRVAQLRPLVTVD